MSFGERISRTPVLGAPYTATMTNENVQVLADGNRIVQNSTGTTARDSQGRTRRDTPLPAIGNLAAANAPHLVFINDPVAQKSYTLNLTDKTAQSMSMPGPAAGGVAAAGGPTTEDGGRTFFFQVRPGGAAASGTQLSDGDTIRTVTINGQVPLSVADEQAEMKSEDLGSQTMEGVLVNGVRTTRTIPAGEVGNEKPISIVTEVWTSPELKVVVMSKRSDPRMGEQTFQLTNIVRGDPDPSLFTVPADFKVIEGPQAVMYQIKQ